MKEQTALVTGASSGIGLELARIFAQEGYNLVLVARRADLLERLAGELRQRHGVWVKVLPKDLAQPSAPDEISHQLVRESIEVDILVNNAGFGIYGEFADGDLKSELNMIRVNVAALTHLTHLFLQGMRKRRHGKILNIASTAGFQPGPLMAVYYATKAYVVSFSQAIANELKGSGVTITALCPGLTESEFHKVAGMDETHLVKGVMMDSRIVAHIGYEALMKGKALAIAGFYNTALAFLVKFAPRDVVTAAVRRIHRRS